MNNNLIPNSRRSPEELWKMGRKGGIASGKVRRNNKAIKEFAKNMYEALRDLVKKQINLFLTAEQLKK